MVIVLGFVNDDVYHFSADFVDGVENGFDNQRELVALLAHSFDERFRMATLASIHQQDARFRNGQRTGDVLLELDYTAVSADGIVDARRRGVEHFLALERSTVDLV